MDKDLGAASHARYQFEQHFGQVPRLREVDVPRAIDGIITTDDQTQHPFSQALKEVLYAGTVVLESTINNRLKNLVRQRFNEADKLVIKLEKQAKRMSFIRKIDERLPSLNIRGRMESFFPGITGLTHEEMNTTYQQVVSNASQLQQRAA